MPQRHRPLPTWVTEPPNPPRSTLLTAWIDPAATPTPRHLTIVRALPVHRRVWLSPDVPTDVIEAGDVVLVEPVRTVADLLDGPLVDLGVDECGIVLLTGVSRKDVKMLLAWHGPGRVRLVRCSRRSGLLDLEAERLVDHCVRYDPQVQPATRSRPKPERKPEPAPQPKAPVILLRPRRTRVAQPEATGTG